VLDSGGTASMTSEIFNLIKNIVASGALALPNGMSSAFGYLSLTQAILYSVMWMTLMGFINAYYFSLIGRVCEMTGSASYRHAWEETVGSTASFIVALVCTIKPALGNLAYSMILADSLQSLSVTAGLEGWTRFKCLMFVTIFVLFPLCMMKNFAILAPFSILGVCGMVFTILSMMYRYFDGSYDFHTGKYVQDLRPEFQPSFTYEGPEPSVLTSMILASMLSTAYVAHYNAPRFFVELKHNTLTRFNTVVGVSYTSAAALYITLGVIGYLTFGNHSSGYILNNYSTNDIVATFCRITIALSVLFTYPVVFVGVRDGIIDLFQMPLQYQTNLCLSLISIGLLAVITFFAATFTDLGIVMSLGGATLAITVIFIFPTFMFHAAVRKLGIHRITISQKREVLIADIVMIFGVGIGCIAVYLILSGNEAG